MGPDRVLSHRGGWGPGVTGRSCREGGAWLVINRAIMAKVAAANLLVSLHLLKMTFLYTLFRKQNSSKEESCLNEL